MDRDAPRHAVAHQAPGARSVERQAARHRAIMLLHRRLTADDAVEKPVKILPAAKFYRRRKDRMRSRDAVKNSLIQVYKAVLHDRPKH